MIKYEILEIMVPGQIIVFDMEVWPNGQEVLQEFTSKIKSMCIDPLGFHPSKCIVEIDAKDYGIPFSEVKRVLPADNEQLELFA